MFEMDGEKSKPAALRPAVTKATDANPGGGQTIVPREKAATGDGPVFHPRGKKEPKPLGSADKFAWLKKGTGRSLRTIESAQLEAGSAPVSSSAGFELLCTYNWASTSCPTIYVPGGPAQWKPVPLPTTLPKDSGTHFIDQNAFRASLYPFEPMFAALDLMKPDFDFSDVDLITNRNSLRKLLDFASGRVPDSFRIDVNLVKSTLFLTRRERSTRGVIQGFRNAGYGHNFERAFTKPQEGLEDSNGHHRVARYEMGELNCVVRFEVDACCEDEGGEEGSEEEHSSGCNGAIGAPETGASQGNGDLLTDFIKLSLGESPSSERSVQSEEGGTSQKENSIEAELNHLSAYEKKKKQPKNSARTRVIKRGRAVPCSTLAEIKSRKTKVRLAEALPQLWFGRTPLLFHATHNEGTFTEQVERIIAAEQFQAWETRRQDMLRKMVRLIEQLRGIAREVKGGACVVVCEKKIRPLKLEVLENTVRKNVLPEEILRRYWRTGMFLSGP